MCMIYVYISFPAKKTGKNQHFFTCHGVTPIFSVPTHPTTDIHHDHRQGALPSPNLVSFNATIAAAARGVWQIQEKGVKRLTGFLCGDQFFLSLGCLFDFFVHLVSNWGTTSSTLVKYKKKEGSKNWEVVKISYQSRVFFTLKIHFPTIGWKLSEAAWSMALSVLQDQASRRGGGFRRWEEKKRWSTTSLRKRLVYCSRGILP